MEFFNNGGRGEASLTKIKKRSCGGEWRSSNLTCEIFNIQIGHPLEILVEEGNGEKDLG